MKQKWKSVAAITVLSGAVIAATTPRSQADVIGNWTFDETTGATAADSINGNNAAWAGDAGANTWVTGLIGGATQHNDEDGGNGQEHFRTGTISQLAGAEAITFSIWFNNDVDINNNSTYNGLMMSRSFDPGSSWGLAITENSYDHKLDGRINGQATYTAERIVPNDSQWHHVALTWDRSTGDRVLYYDGEQVSSGNNAVNAIVSATDIRFGDDACCGSREYTGTLDDAVLWSDALTATHVRLIYERGINSGLGALVTDDFDLDGLSDADETNIHLTDPKNPDTDGDGVLDGEELNGTLNPFLGGVLGSPPGDSTDPLSDDSDGDLLLDGWEMTNNLDPNSTLDPNGTGDDPDGDLLDNYDEQFNPEYTGVSTDPQDPDTDGDGIDDNKETYGTDNTAFFDEPTDPTNPDCDDDGLTDGQETSGSENTAFSDEPTDPNLADTDDDFLLDKQETDNDLDPNDGDDPYDDTGDPDGDTIDNYDEINTYGTNPVDADTDADGLDDDEELFTYLTDPLNIDSDGDYIDDGDEVTGDDNPWTGDTLGTPPGDPTDPAQWDSDGDGIDDGDEIDDGFGSAFITNPNNNDTDGDGFYDGAELDAGTDPTDENDYPEYYANLVGYWPLDNAIGMDAIDKTGNVGPAPFKNNFGLTWVLGGPGGSMEGICGYADLSNDSGSYFEIPAIPGLAAANNANDPAFTIMGWVKPKTGNNGYRGIFMSRNVEDNLGTGKNYGLAVENTDQAEARLNTGGGLDGSSGDLPFGVWSHIAMTYDGSTRRLFVNGQQANSRAQSDVTSIIAATGFALGTDTNNADRRINGFLDDFATFDVALPGGVITGIYDHGLVGENLLHQFPEAPTEMVDTDSDDDGICDQWEYDLIGDLSSDFSPTSDVDGDGLPDLDEATIHGTDPIDADTDDDDINDGPELDGSLNPYGSLPTDPLNPDSDNDGIEDGDEVSGLIGSGDITDPNDRDTDDDGVADGQEVADGTDPTDAGDVILPVITGNMVTYYNFDEGTGTTAADTAINGAAQEPATQNSGTLTWLTLTDPKIGSSCINLNGGTDMVATTPLSGSTTAFTVSVWVWSDSITAAREGIYTHHGAAADEYWGITLKTDGGSDYRVANQNHSVPTGTFVTGEWQHVVITWDGTAGVATTFVDGFEMTSLSGVATTFNATLNPWYIGSDYPSGNDRRMQGRLDDMAIFDTLLSDADILSVADAGHAGIPVTTLLPEFAVPATIEILSISHNPTADTVDLSWDSSAGASAYKVVYSDDLTTPVSTWPTYPGADNVLTGGATTSTQLTNVTGTAQFYVVVEK